MGEPDPQVGLPAGIPTGTPVGSLYGPGLSCCCVDPIQLLKSHMNYKRPHYRQELRK